MTNFILVDDDISALRGLQYYFSKNKKNCQVVGTFSNAQEALGFLKKNSVDVVITDIQMPGMTGNELIRAIRKENPYIPIIVLSAYDNFTYVRDALVDRVVDYLLKPYDLKLLENAIEKAVTTSISLKESREKKNRERAIREFLNSRSKVDPPSQLQSPFFMATYRLAGIVDTKLEDRVAKELLALFREEVYVFGNNGYTLLIAPSFVPSEEWKESLCVLQDLYEKKYSVKLMLVWRAQCEYLFLADEKRFCVEKLHFLQFNQLREVSDEAYYTAREQKISLKECISLQELVRLILGLKHKELEEYLKLSWKRIKERYALLYPDRIRDVIVRLCVELEVELRCYYKEKIIESPEPNVSISRYIRESSDMEMLGSRFFKIVLGIEIGRQENQKLPVYILSAVSFINENYQKPITLKEVAQFAYVNNWYLSTQFAKIMKVSIKEYINQVRIHHAITLLNEPDAKIYEVSSKVGFSDPSYFSAVFKKNQGITPKEYQKRREKS